MMSGPPWWYSVYGLAVQSDFRLPTEACDPLPDGPPDVAFVRTEQSLASSALPAQLVAELVCSGPCHQGEVYSRVYRGPAGSWIVRPGVATCFVAAAGNSVEVHPEPGASDLEVGLLLVGQVSIVVLQYRERPCLHASAVVVGSRAAAFVGSAGCGKSTMAACFVNHGGPLMTDDLLALRVGPDRVEVHPGLPLMKLWRSSVEKGLHLHEELPNVAGRADKKLLLLQQRFPHARTAAPLAAVYVLDRYAPDSVQTADVNVARLAGRQALGSLLAHTPHIELLLPSESARLMRAYARLAQLVPIRALSIPDGFDHQDAVYARILADLEAQ